MKINKILFDGFEALEMINGTNRLVVTTSIGPRICFFGKNENILFWDKDKVTRGDFVLYGGHRVWLTRPYADESEDTYISDNDPCEVEIFGNGVKVIAKKNRNGIRRGMILK